MDEPNQPLTKEKAIKRFLLIVIATIAFTSIMIFLGYGKIPIKPLLISLAIVLPIMIISAFVGFKYRRQIVQHKGKLSYVYLVIGLCMIIINGFLIIIGESGINYYVQLGVGFMFLFYGIKQIKNK